MTSVKGTFSYCGYGEPAALELICTGTHCDALIDFPETNCTTSGTTTICTNDVQCEKALWTTDLNFDLADAENALVQQKHTTTIPECEYQFEVTSDGKPAGVILSDITPPNAQCNSLIQTDASSNDTTPSGSGNATVPLSSKTAPPLTVSTAGAPKNLKTPYMLVVLVFLGFFMPGLAHGVVARLELVAKAQIIPAEPDKSLFPKNTKTDICVQLGNLVTARSLESRTPAYGELSVLEKRDIESFFQNYFVKKGLGYIAGKLRNYQHDKQVFAECFRAEVSSYVCKQAVKELLPKVTGIAVIKELVPACISVITELAVFDMEPITKVGLFVFAGVFCNWFVAEAIPVIPCLQDAVCKKFEDLFPESRCEAPPPGTPPPAAPVGTVFTYKTRSSIDYQSGGSLLTNPNKCGTFFNQASLKYNTLFGRFANISEVRLPKVRERRLYKVCLRGENMSDFPTLRAWW
jgi:hypothetical protein